MSQDSEIEEFLQRFGSQCVEFGLYYDQFMRNELTFGEITRRLSEATGEAEGGFADLKEAMSEAQINRFHGFQQALESMTIALIEMEIKRNKEIIEKSIINSEYFLVNIIYNSIISSINMIYAESSPEKQSEKIAKITQVSREQSVLKGMIKVLNAIEQYCAVETFGPQEYAALEKALGIYVEHFAFIADVEPKKICDEKVFQLLKKHGHYLDEKGYFGNREHAYQHIQKCAKHLELIASNKQNLELQRLVEFVRPPSPDEKLEQLYQDVLNSKTETDVYSAVTAFMNFAELIPSHPQVHRYKQRLRGALQEKGFM